MFSQKGINKVRRAKVITGNEDKEFIIPELNDYISNEYDIHLDEEQLKLAKGIAGVLNEISV